MAGIMGRMLKRILKLQWRRRRRFRAPKGLYVIMGGATVPGKNQVCDIGMGGLSFYYVDSGVRADRDHQTLTVSTAGKPAVVHVPCRTVSDSDTGELLLLNQRVRRRSVKFERLSGRHKAQIKDLIKKHVINHGPQRSF